MDHLTVVAAVENSVSTRIKSVEALDRGVSFPRFSEDEKLINFLVTDDQSVYPAQVNIASGVVTRFMKSPMVLSGWNSEAKSSIALSVAMQSTTKSMRLKMARCVSSRNITMI